MVRLESRPAPTPNGGSRCLAKWLASEKMRDSKIGKCHFWHLLIGIVGVFWSQKGGLKSAFFETKFGPNFAGKIWSNLVISGRECRLSCAGSLDRNARDRPKPLVFGQLCTFKSTFWETFYLSFWSLFGDKMGNFGKKCPKWTFLPNRKNKG